jgi:hypothetical protein
MGGANMFSWYQPQWPEVSHSALVEDLRRVDLFIVVLEAGGACRRAGSGTSRQPLACQNTTPGPLFLEMEQVHLPAEPAVIALLGLFQHVQIGIKLCLVGPGRAVDARQHRLLESPRQ